MGTYVLVVYLRVIFVSYSITNKNITKMKTTSMTTLLLGLSGLLVTLAGCQKESIVPTTTVSQAPEAGTVETSILLPGALPAVYATDGNAQETTDFPFPTGCFPTHPGGLTEATDGTLETTDSNTTPPTRPDAPGTIHAQAEL